LPSTPLSKSSFDYSSIRLVNRPVERINSQHPARLCRWVGGTKRCWEFRSPAGCLLQQVAACEPAEPRGEVDPPTQLAAKGHRSTGAAARLALLRDCRRSLRGIGVDNMLAEAVAGCGTQPNNSPGWRLSRAECGNHWDSGSLLARSMRRFRHNSRIELAARRARQWSAQTVGHTRRKARELRAPTTLFSAVRARLASLRQ
jgi:hypothetical protein